jgi:Nucleotidyl transferase of unknown function (DUF2204)
MNRTWPDQLISEKEWEVYRQVIMRAREEGIPFAVGGGFAVAAYTGRWRDTKDLDLYTTPAHRDALIGVTADAGLKDFYARSPYDRRWIYRAACGDVIVDIIFAMANLRAHVDEQWLREGGEIHIRGENLPVVPAEEMVWNKLYVMQHDRCDWTDVLNLLYSSAQHLDWEYLLNRLGDDTPLLAAALSIYRWLCPGRSRRVPAWVWERLQVTAPGRDAIPEIDWHHTTLLDLRPWFAVVESP